MIDHGKTTGVYVPTMWSRMDPTNCAAGCLPQMPLRILESQKEG